MCWALRRAVNGSSRKKACSAGFEEVEYAVGRWVAGNMKAAIAKVAIDPPLKGCDV